MTTKCRFCTQETKLSLLKTSIYLSRVEKNITAMAMLAGFSRCAASEKSLSPESCFDNQSKRSLRPSAPSLASVSAAVIYGTYNKKIITKPDNNISKLPQNTDNGQLPFYQDEQKQAKNLK